MDPIDELQRFSSAGGHDTPAESVVDERFEIRATIGAGAMGVVYLAYDRARRMEVALKALRHIDGKTLFNFKNEFRSLSHIVHRNLVTLYELRSAAGHWFFTMELLRGRSFLRHVRELPRQDPAVEPASNALTGPLHAATTPYPAGTADPAQYDVTRTIMPGARSAPAPSNDPATTLETLVSPGSTGGGSSSGAGAAALLDAHRQAIMAAPLREAPLRDALGQLAEGVHALHEYGKLHCDLKPSNVLVVPGADRSDDRVVVCDFGLVTDVQVNLAPGAPRRVAGTPAYMAPEQAAGDALDRSSDWYSVGVMLHEALTGRHPFHGSTDEVLEQKQVADAKPCRTYSPSIPDDLADLCDDLLRRDPSQRPTGEQVLERLGREHCFVELGAGTVPGSQPFVGRKPELATLWNALGEVRAGSASAVFVHGPSGLGKSALVHHFLEQVGVDAPEAIVLEGRCYERESVPYKSIDSILDALSAMLASADSDDVARLIPRDVACLARLFPVLNRVAAVADNEGVVPVDPQELRQRAFGALRELVRRVASNHLTVLSIDDLQWGDADSAAFLRDLIHHPNRPPLLLLGTYRTAEAESSPLLRALLRRSTGDDGDLRQVELHPLSADDTRKLAEHILSTGPEVENELFGALARDTGGNPFFVTELARARIALGEVSPETGPGSTGLDGLLALRVSRLPDDARELLTAAAVAGRPTPRSLLARVAKVDNELAAVALLQAEHLVRVRTSDDGDHDLETYHDRIRETITARLPRAARRSCHRRLAKAYESTGAPDPQSLVDHWLGAGDDRRAGEYAVRAGQQAADAAAFHHAERYFGLALDLLDLNRDNERQLQALRGDALAAAGNALEGARLHLAAAEDAAPSHAIELKRRAMMHFLRGGHLGEGLDLAREVLRAVGLGLPRGRRSAMASVLYRKLALTLGSGRRKGGRAKPLDDRARQRMDVCWSVQTGVAIVNPLYGATLQLRYMQDARRYDDSYRAAIALGLELGFTGMVGTSGRERVDEISRQAIELAEQCGNPHGRGVAVSLSGFAAFLMGQWSRGAEGCGRGAQILLDECTGAQYEVDIARIYWLASLLYAGRLRDATRIVPPLLREAVEMGNVYLSNALRSWRTNLVWLVLDDPEGARTQLAAASEPPMERGEFHLHHFYPWASEVQVELYVGDAARAWEVLHQRWGLWRKSLLTRIQSVRIESEYLYGRAALAVAATGHDQDAMLAEADRRTRELEGEGAAWAAPMALLLRAGAARIKGDEAGAAEQLTAAERASEAAEMPAFAAAARLCRAPLVGGAEGAELDRAARQWMQAECVANPARWAALYAPGLSATGRSDS